MFDLAFLPGLLCTVLLVTKDFFRDTELVLLISLSFGTENSVCFKLCFASLELSDDDESDEEL